MVSIDRDYSRVMLFDPSGPSRQRITNQLEAPPTQPELINPYITSIDDSLSGPYYFRVETISASNSRGLADLPDFKLPGVILLSLDKKTMGTFINVSTQLLEAKVYQRCSIVCIVGTADLKFHAKLQRTVALAEQKGLTCTIDWDSEHPKQDAAAGLMGLSARLKRVVHRAMCADRAVTESTNLEHRDNKSNTTEQSSNSGGGGGGSSSAFNPKSEHGSIEAEKNTVAKLMNSIQTSPLKRVRPSSASSTMSKKSLFNFDRAGKAVKAAAAKKSEKTEKGNRWHRKHSLNSTELQKLLGESKLSNKMKAKLKNITKITKKKIENRPVVAIFRDVLQPNFIKINLPLQRTSKSDTLTWSGYEMLYDLHVINYKHAIYNFTIALQDNMDHFYARFYRALAYATVGRFRPALKDMKICLTLVQKNKIDSTCPGADSMPTLLYKCNFNLALLHLNTHDHDIAVKRLEICKRVQPFSPETSALRGFIRRRRGNYKECRFDYVHHSKLLLRKNVGAAAAALIEHNHSSKEEKRTMELYHKQIRSPKKKSQILSFLTSIQKSLLTFGPDRNEMHIQYIAAFLSSQMWFKKISKENQTTICRHVEYSTLDTGEWVCRRGDYADAFYVLMSGSINIMALDVGMASETLCGSLYKNDYFGELGLLNFTNRTASLCANKACEVLTFSLHIFNKCGVRQALKEVHDDKRDALIMSNVFNGLPEIYLTNATNFAVIKIFEQGDVILKQGQHSESLFIVLQGVCDVWQKIDIREELQHRKKILIDTLESLHMKYVYHHQNIYQSNARPENKTDVRDDTLVEEKMSHLEQELVILKAQIIEMDRQRLAHYRKKTKKSKWKALRNKPQEPATASTGKTKMKKKKKEKIHLTEIMTPSFFGEASLRGDGSLEHAEVKASTRVVALRIFMSQMDFSKVNDSFLNRLSNLSSVKPLSLERLSERAKNEIGWEEYRSTLMSFIDKMKWPVRHGHVVPGPCGTSIIHELAKPNGVL